MNSLSWLLYFIDISSSFKEAAPPFLAFGAFVLFLRALIPRSLNVLDGRRPGDGLYMTAPRQRGWLLVLCAGFMLYISIPSKNTLYAIAASEVGERVVNSETVQGLTSDATKALQLWLRRQIENDKNK